jgi:hypothetical protein
LLTIRAESHIVDDIFMTGEGHQQLNPFTGKIPNFCFPVQAGGSQQAAIRVKAEFQYDTLVGCMGHQGLDLRNGASTQISARHARDIAQQDGSQLLFAEDAIQRLSGLILKTKSALGYSFRRAQSCSTPYTRIVPAFSIFISPP